MAIGKILGKVEVNTIIKRIKGKPLKQTERNYLSRSIRPKLLAARILTQEKLLEKINRPDKSLEKKIIYNLNKYGYTLITIMKLKKQKIIKIEDLIGIIITKQPKPRYIEAIPVILLKNKIDLFKLAEVAFKYNIKNQIGYLVETAIIIAKKLKIKHDLNKILEYLQNNKEKHKEFLGEEKDDLYKNFLIKTTPPRMKKWNLLGRYFDNDFIKNTEAYL
ncbi:hypothetical protein JXB41_09140 [Candidatus Woesearchaeota archaeon]|nr:hypothetical protein [Candidatus Woesearchaeota archaeon]